MIQTVFRFLRANKDLVMFAMMVSTRILIVIVHNACNMDARVVTVPIIVLYANKVFLLALTLILACHNALTAILGQIPIRQCLGQITMRIVLTAWFKMDKSLNVSHAKVVSFGIVSVYSNVPKAIMAQLLTAHVALN